MRFGIRKGVYCCALLLGAGYLLAPVRPTVACGESMAPTLKNGSVHLLDVAHYRREPVRAGDVVVFQRGKSSYVKRVVAVAGETVYLLRQGDGSAGELLEDWQLARFRRIAERSPWPTGLTLEELTIPEGTCFVLGDNAVFSEDSRHFGPVRLEAIRGKVLFTPESTPESERIARAPRPGSRS